MISQKLYYGIKPILPFYLRRAVRRQFARRQRQQAHGVWPVLPGSERPPEGWPGWPDGKEFAFLITHDVEGQAGLDRCRQLMELDRKWGFRSSFNFIPEGKYRVSTELREELTRNGFEVGVHDLRHDGKLYAGRQGFEANAVRINRYLKEWGAVGFRSGFMLHKLEWLHDLDIQYDASTFDTDPFEPQPDGVKTIFPFWHKGSDGSGYVELPYTLPQDSTLFLLFDERGTDIWMRKLDWVAEHGGMALVNVHPDYVRFSGDSQNCSNYPVELYESFLKEVAGRYTGRYWQALPRQAAGWYRKSMLDSCAHASPESNGVANGKTSAGDTYFTPLRTQPASSYERRPMFAQTSDGIENFSVNDTKPLPKIWIDLDNTPHVVFFEPIIDELRARGYPLLVTARDAFQVCELADKKNIPYQLVGRHSGKNRIRKVAGLLMRSLQLAPYALREKPALSLSHGARSQVIISNLMGIPSLLLADYEYAKYPPLMRPTWEMVPSVIPDDKLCRDRAHIFRYPGIKEDAYVWKFQPDHGIRKELGLSESDVVITVRPPASEAHYHNPESDKLFTHFMDYACGFPQTRIVLLPRNNRQGEFIRSNWPQWFKDNKTVVPKSVVDGLNLIWHSDLLVSGGGTMNREATALGVPVYSIFLGAIGAVDKHLEQTGRLILIKSVAEIPTKIRLEKRPPPSSTHGQPTETLRYIVETVEKLVNGGAVTEGNPRHSELAGHSS